MKQEAPINTKIRGLLIFAAFCAVSACAQQQDISPTISIDPVDFKALSGWADDDLSGVLSAFRKSCAVLTASDKNSRASQLRIAERSVDLRPSCNAAANVEENNKAGLRGYFEKWFSPYAVRDHSGDREGLLTGYYEPELRGSRTARGQYKIPLYGRPDNLVTADLGLFDPALKGRKVAGLISKGALVPYHDRKTIDGNHPVTNLQPLVWVDSQVDAFFLHIQGSGRIKLAEGGLLRLGYAANNGHPYTAIGGTLARRGEIPLDRISMQSIRAWLAANPEKAKEVMAQNARYIFFRELTGNAPIGAQGVELTAGRSLAVDRRAIPLGMPIWVDTADPIDPHKPYRRLMIAQDVGHAIKGVIRGDIFFGHGLLAARRAGLMKSRGQFFVLLPKVAPDAS